MHEASRNAHRRKALSRQFAGAHRTSPHLHPATWNFPGGQPCPTAGSSSAGSFDCSLHIEQPTPIERRPTLAPNADEGAEVMQHRRINQAEHPLGLPYRLREDGSSDAASRQRDVIAPEEKHWVVRKRRHVDSSNSGSSQNSEDAALPRGCVWGNPIPVASPCTVVEGFSAESAMIRSIQNDNFKFLQHMICLGWMSNSSSSCNFSVTVDRSVSEEPEVLQITGGSVLHYAVCCNSLEAAAALAIAFPELARKQCAVEHRSAAGHVTSSHWTALDFASFFCNLYLDRDPPRHHAFRRASVVLLTLHQNPDALPFMKLGSGAARLKAAGDAAHVMATLAALAD